MEKVIDLIEGMNNMRNDLISRQAARSFVCNVYRAIGLTDNQMMALCEGIKALPSVQPERKKGKWTNENGADGWNRCSVCDELAIDLFDFCPNCGADMRGAEDD